MISTLPVRSSAAWIALTRMSSGHVEHRPVAVALLVALAVDLVVVQRVLPADDETVGPLIRRPRRRTATSAGDERRLAAAADQARSARARSAGTAGDRRAQRLCAGRAARQPVGRRYGRPASVAGAGSRTSAARCAGRSAPPRARPRAPRAPPRVPRAAPHAARAPAPPARSPPGAGRRPATRPTRCASRVVVAEHERERQRDAEDQRPEQVHAERDERVARCRVALGGRSRSRARGAARTATSEAA